MVGGRPGRTPGPRGAGGYVSEPHMPVTTATRPYPRITLFFYFYPPSPSRRPARTHARFRTSRWGKFKRRHVLKSGPGPRHNAPLRLNLPLIFLFSIGGSRAHALLSKRSVCVPMANPSLALKPGLAVDYGGVSLPAKERGSNPTQQEFPPLQ